MIEAVLHDILGANVNTGVCSNVADSGGEDMTLYHMRIPQSVSVVKGLVYNVIAGNQAYCKKGTESTEQFTVQIDIYHISDVEARTVATAVKSLLSGWAGTVNSVRWNYTTLQGQRRGVVDDIDTVNYTQTYIFNKA